MSCSPTSYRPGPRRPRHPAISWQPCAVKKIGRIPDGGGWRAHGRGAASIARDRSTKVGFDYVHSLVDDHSQLAYSEVLTDEKGPTCAGFLARAAAYFAAHGITRLERVMTDNAWAYKWSLRGIIGDRNTYTSIYPGGNGVHPKLRGFLTGGGGATSETKLSGAAP